jgi:purine-binding chemotaxis protein CheW
MTANSGRVGRFDWDEVRATLERAAAGLGTARLSPEQARAVLDERARALARVPVRPPNAAESIEAVTFRLGDERDALETRFVRRVERVESPTPVPGAPDVLVGLVNLHGEILAVFDLRVLLGIARAEATDRTRVIVVGNDGDEFGILADAAHDVVTLRTSEVLAFPGALEGLARLGLSGITHDALVVIDGAALLRDDRLVINLEAEPGA